MRVNLNIVFLIFFSFFIQTISEAKVIKFKNCKSTFDKRYENIANDFISRGFIKGNLNKKILYNIINHYEKRNFIIDTEKKTLIENLSYSEIRMDDNKNYKTLIGFIEIDIGDLSYKWRTKYNYKIQDNNVFTVLNASFGHKSTFTAAQPTCGSQKWCLGSCFSAVISNMFLASIDLSS